MTYSELTEYIRHYLENDKTKSAIMLSGEWGTGKSHFVQNVLIPGLVKDGDSRCVVVSLYGLQAIPEISKSIYLEMRAKAFQPRGEATVTGKVAAKTVVKGITSFFGIDLSLSETDMQKVYESVDLSGKLIVLEDVERSQINILELLGYVNNLVEQDGVKVLLIANEEVLITYEPIQEESNEKQKLAEILDKLYRHKDRKYTKETEQYLIAKEKTISDTIQFEGDYITAVQQIISKYNSLLLEKFNNEDSAKDICDIMSICQNYNLRSFIFACQKAVDIYEKMDDSYSDDFIQCIFYGIIFFSLRLKTGQTMQWDGGEHYSISLGHEKTPLFKFCFNYIMYQSLNTATIPLAVEAFSKMKLYDKDKTANDPDLQVLFSYYIHYENEVKEAVESITKRLEIIEDISFYDYGSIAVYLIIVQHSLGCDIEKAKKLLVRNLEGRGRELEIEAIFRTVMGDEDSAIKEEYEQLRREMGHALKMNINPIPDFDYRPDQSHIFCDYAVKNDGLFHLRSRFVSDFDVVRLAEMFAACSPKQKDDVRSAFLAVYRVANIKQFITGDLGTLEELYQIVKNDSDKEMDKIQMIQYKWFIENLADIIEKLR